MSLEMKFFEVAIQNGTKKQFRVKIIGEMLKKKEVLPLDHTKGQNVFGQLKSDILQIVTLLETTAPMKWTTHDHQLIIFINCVNSVSRI